MYTFVSMDDRHANILAQSAQLFMRLGIRSVNMDDVAKELGMSKKTLYKYVKDKNDLVHQVFSEYLRCEEQMVSNILTENDNAIDEIIGITKFVSEQLGNIHPAVLFDMQKYYPDVWSLMEKHKQNFIYSCTLNNLERGMKQGYYRSNLNADVIARLYVAKIDVVLDSAVFPSQEYQLAEVHMEWMRYHIRGIATRKGIDYLKAKLKSENIQL